MEETNSINLGRINHAIVGAGWLVGAEKKGFLWLGDIKSTPQKKGDTKSRAIFLLYLTAETISVAHLYFDLLAFHNLCLPICFLIWGYQAYLSIR